MFFLLQVALLIGAICLFGSPYSPSVFDLMTRKQAATTPAQSLETTPAPVVNRLDEGGTDSGDIRRIVWTGAIKVWERYPILGSGVETFAYSYYKDRPMAHNLVSEWDFLYNKAHNEFLNFLATTGIVGLLTYLFLLGAIVFAPGLPESAFNFFHKKRLTLLNFKELNEEQKNALFIVGMALSSGVVALSVSNFFGFSTVMVSLLLLLFPAFWVVFAQKKNEASQTLEKLPTTFSMTQVVLLCLLFFVSLTLIFHVYEMWEADRIFAKGKQNSEANQVNVGLPLLEQAVSIAPDEPYFSDELAVTDARVAAALGTNGSATEAAQFAQRSIELSNQTLEMNNVNLNFYKSQARVYSLLAQLDPKFIQNALKTLNKARELAPTDPKLQYNVSVLELNFGNPEQGYKDLIRSIEMKPNYIQARLNLGEYYEAQGKIDLAKEQYEYILTKIQSNDVESLARMATLATMSAKTK